MTSMRRCLHIVDEYSDPIDLIVLMLSMETTIDSNHRLI